MTGRRRLTVTGAVVVACLVALHGTARTAIAQQGSLFSSGAGAQGAEPLVLVVHGVGTDLYDLASGGEPRAEGWSNSVAKAYGTSVTEITFRPPGRTAGQSFVDAPYSGVDWARDVQSQIQAAVKANPGRRVVIVSHSWGTVVTKLALGGGTLKNGEIQPIQGVAVDDWITMGSPIGDHKLTSPYGGGINFWADGKPGAVRNWVNFFDPLDAVSVESQNLEGAENVEVTSTGFGSWIPGWRAFKAHEDIWTNSKVVQHVKQRIADLGRERVSQTTRPADTEVRRQGTLFGSTPRPPAPPAPPAPAPVAGGAPDYSPICQSAMKAIERHFAASYGPEFVRIEWVRPFTYDKGDCVGGYKVWAMRLSDRQQWTPLEWNADTGTGRVPVTGLVQQYAKDNPDLQWTPTSGRTAPAAARGVPDYAPVCQSAMTAIERHFARSYGPEFVRIEWVRPFTYDKGDCVGGYRVWAKRLSDQKQWAPLEWNADTGTGRAAVASLTQQYGKDNPDLQWTPTAR